MDATERTLSPLRESERFAGYGDLKIQYEGSSQDIPVRVPDLSSKGMFVNTSRHFAQGSVLKIAFKLSRTGLEINCRAEVRYCLDGVGIGVEFVDISDEAREAIEEEIRHRNRS